jgi:hypothetical protein
MVLSGIDLIARAAGATGTLVAVGGRRAPQSVRKAAKQLAYYSDISSLIAFSATIGRIAAEK